MTNELQLIIQTLDKLRGEIATPFWLVPAFWISTIIGLASVYYSVKAFVEARRAKRAATEAGRTAKIQTITIELTELAQRLDKLKQDITFAEARDLLNEVSRKIRRLVSPFRSDNELGETISSLKEALTEAKSSLNDVRPTGQSDSSQTPYAVYNAIEGDLSSISGIVADLLGLFEKQTIDLGDTHDDT